VGSPRLFVAIELPQDVRRSLERSLDPWRESLPGVRWGTPENWHVTLVFLGATDPRRIPRIQEQLGEVAGATPRFRAALAGVGGFPSGRRARIVWAGIDDSGGHMARLAASVAGALGTPLEHDPFSAHVTVGRAPRPIRLPDGSTDDPPDAAFDVSELVLFRSHLGGGAPRYEPLARLALASPTLRTR
jgi:RNA 2',3'-cyclic 3'-phosphodiesterase